MDFIGIVPDTSVLMFYIFGNSKQKEEIQKKIYSYKNIVINPILRSEIGRVIISSFFKLNSYIQSYLSNKEHFLLSDFWIDMIQKINKIYSNQLCRGLTYILQYYRNKFDRFPLDSSDPYYAEKEIDRINSAINIVIEELIEFQEEISNWEIQENFSCHQSNWEITYNEENSKYILTYNSSCSQKFCPKREEKLNSLIQTNKNLFLKIINDGEDIAKKDFMSLDNKLYTTIKKLINIDSNKEKFNFKRKYCYHLGDFLISLILQNNKDNLYTLNIGHFNFLFYILDIDLQRIIQFSL